jgi:hypothetical protein
MSQQIHKPTIVAGVPTELDVKKLLDAYPSPQPDVVIPWIDLENLLGYTRTSIRFKTVVSAWRKRIYDNLNLHTEAVRGEGLKVVEGGARVEAARDRQKQGFRKVIKAGDIAAATERQGLSPDELRVCDHVANVGSQHRLALKNQPKKLPALSFEHKPTWR